MRGKIWNNKINDWEYVDQIKGNGFVTIDPSVVTQTVRAWLSEHPEATTTIQNNSITQEKLAPQLKGDKIIYFETIKDMKEYSEIKSGMVCEILGYHKVNDGGGGLYIISPHTVEIEDNGLYHLVKNNCVAALLPQQDTTVMSFGAVGDGIADDTKAIENFLNAVDKFKNIVHNYGLSFGGEFETIRFGSGQFRIKRPITFSTKITEIDFTGSVILNSVSYSMFAFNFDYCFNFKIIGGCFANGNIFKMSNPNADQGRLVLAGIEFKGCNIAYDIMAQSSAVFVYNNKFDKVKQLINIASDMCIFAGNWCECPQVNEDFSGNICQTGGEIHVYDNVFVPLENPIDDPSGKETAWIAQKSRWVTCENNRFGGEPGRRSCLNYDFSYANSDDPIHIDSGFIFKGNLCAPEDKTGIAIRLFKIPKSATITDNHNLVYNKYLVGFSEIKKADVKHDLNILKDEYLHQKEMFNDLDFHSRYTYNISNNHLHLYPNSNNEVIEDEAEWVFLLNNYTNNVEDNLAGYRFSVGEKQHNYQNINSIQQLGSGKDKIILLPCKIPYNGMNISATWSNLFAGVECKIPQRILVQTAVTETNGAVKTRIVSNALLAQISENPELSNRMEVGYYKDDMAPHFEDFLPNDYKGICIKIKSNGSTNALITLSSD